MEIRRDGSPATGRPRNRPLRVKMILPALVEATSPGYHPIKYALFPPLGLAGLAGYLDPDVEVELVDEHVQTLCWNDVPPNATAKPSIAVRSPLK